jgi:hypothetical protein
LLRRSRPAWLLPPCAWPDERGLFQTGLRPEPPAAVPRGPRVPHSTAAGRALSRASPCQSVTPGGWRERASRSANRRRRAGGRAAAGEDRARARSFSAGSGISSAPAFPRMRAAGTPLARAERPEGQGEEGTLVDRFADREARSCRTSALRLTGRPRRACPEHSCSRDVSSGDERLARQPPRRDRRGTTRSPKSPTLLSLTAAEDDHRHATDD